MSAELDRIIGATRAQRVELAAGVEALRTKLPHNVGFDEQGRVFLKAQGDGGSAAAASVTSSGHPLRTGLPQGPRGWQQQRPRRCFGDIIGSSTSDTSSGPSEGPAACWRK